MTVFKLINLKVGSRFILGLIFLTFILINISCENSSKKDFFRYTIEYDKIKDIQTDHHILPFNRQFVKINDTLQALISNDILSNELNIHYFDNNFNVTGQKNHFLYYLKNDLYKYFSSHALNKDSILVFRDGSNSYNGVSNSLFIYSNDNFYPLDFKGLNFFKNSKLHYQDSSKYSTHHRYHQPCVNGDILYLPINPYYFPADNIDLRKKFRIPDIVSINLKTNKKNVYYNVFDYSKLNKHFSYDNSQVRILPAINNESLIISYANDFGLSSFDLRTNKLNRTSNLELLEEIIPIEFLKNSDTLVRITSLFFHKRYINDNLVYFKQFIIESKKEIDEFKLNELKTKTKFYLLYDSDLDIIGYINDSVYPIDVLEPDKLNSKNIRIKENKEKSYSLNFINFKLNPIDNNLLLSLKQSFDDIYNSDYKKFYNFSEMNIPDSSTLVIIPYFMCKSYINNQFSVIVENYNNIFKDNIYLLSDDLTLKSFRSYSKFSQINKSNYIELENKEFVNLVPPELDNILICKIFEGQIYKSFEYDGGVSLQELIKKL